MSGFSAVDNSPDPAALVRFLDTAAEAESGMKHYAVAAHALRRPERPILDVGCGAGHDLQLFAAAGMSAVGVDPSSVMIGAARVRIEGSGTPLVRGLGEALPFRSGAFSGCRVERVLMHVDDPVRLLSEAVRCVEPGGLITAFEPDWTRLRVRSEVLPELVPWIASAKHPDVGAQLWMLLEERGCCVLDRIEELSVWRSLAVLERVSGFPESVQRAVTAGRISRDQAESWISEQRRRESAGEFFALMPKVQVVATRM